MACGGFVRGDASLTLSRAQDFPSVLARANKLAAGPATCPRGEAPPLKAANHPCIAKTEDDCQRLERRRLKGGKKGGAGEGGGVGIEEKNAVMYHTLASKGCSKIERKASELQTDGRIVSTRAKREKKREAQHTLLAKSFSADGEQTLVRPIEDRLNHQSQLNYAAV